MVTKDRVTDWKEKNTVRVSAVIGSMKVDLEMWTYPREQPEVYIIRLNDSSSGSAQTHLLHTFLIWDIFTLTYPNLLLCSYLF